MKAIIIIILCFVLTVRAASAVLCTEEYCETYINDNICPELPLGCTIQNDTYNGIVLPFAGACNCCEYCVENIGENESCAIGDAASPVPVVICGDLLSCEAGETDNICTPSYAIDVSYVKEEAKFGLACRERSTYFESTTACIEMHCSSSLQFSVQFTVIGQKDPFCVFV